MMTKELIHIYINYQDYHFVFQRDIPGKYLILTNKANQQNYQDHH